MHKKKRSPGIPALPTKHKRAKPQPKLDVPNPEIKITSQFGQNLMNEFAAHLSEELGKSFRKKQVPLTSTFSGFLEGLIEKKHKQYALAIKKSPFNDVHIWLTGSAQFEADAIPDLMPSQLPSIMYEYDEICSKLDKVNVILSEFPDSQLPGEKEE